MDVSQSAKAENRTSCSNIPSRHAELVSASSEDPESSSG